MYETFACIVDGTTGGVEMPFQQESTLVLVLELAHVLENGHYN